MRFLIVLTLLELFSATVFARDLKIGQGWVLMDATVAYRPDMAGLCSGAFLLTISQPKEKIECGGLMDTLFLADLAARKVYWSRPALESVTPQERRVDLENVYYQLKSDGLETLESMRSFYLTGIDQTSSEQCVDTDHHTSPCTGRSIKMNRGSPYISPR